MEAAALKPLYLSTPMQGTNTLQHSNTLKICKFRKSVTHQQQPTHNVDTRDPTGSKNSILPVKHLMDSPIQTTKSLIKVNEFEKGNF